MSSNPFGNFSGALGSLGGFGNALSGAGEGALGGAGDLSSRQIAAQGPDMNVTWDELIASPDYEKYGELYNSLPYQTGNYSDALIDWGKFGINRNVAFSEPSESNEYGSWTTPAPTFGRISATPSTINLDGNAIAQRGAYDRDPTEYMGAYDPRLQLIMQDAKGWNDPLSNWIQDQGWNRAMTLIGNPNYRGRNNDSSSMMFQDPATYYATYLGDDAAKVLNADPAAIKAAQDNWATNMTPGAQSARDDAMFGGGGFLGDLGPLASFAAMVPGPWQPFAMALNAANSLEQGNILGAVLSGAGAVGGFGGLDVGGADFFGEGTAGAFADWGGAGLDVGGLTQLGNEYTSLAADGLGGYAPTDFATGLPEEQFFDDAMQQGTGLNDPDMPWNSLNREYNQLMAENPLLEQGMRYVPKGYKALTSKGAKEDAVRRYLTGEQEKAASKQEERSARSRGVQSKRRTISALAGV